MAVSERTAARAVQRWDLDGGRAMDLECGCRIWSSVSLMLRQGSGRRVVTCRAHR